ncbi:hypothetical protein SLEP1_g5631 [Rubroshorea leprosula]|uniref:RRM domain-containing protein n=1 Tax=Rubroshorea leprosula TaxID=152421 RepID=A0AAV5I0K2_9ROSI|nr:hypothetical protein SLEP1_g5631 [Rubroshorea leprosula]
MWTTFYKFGRVFDIYSPSRRSKKGRRFGFVRFLGVKDIKELERRLDQIWVGKYKLWVNTPRFRNEEQNKVEEPIKIQIMEPKIQNRTYVDVVKGQYGNGLGGDVSTTLKDSLNMSHGRDNRRSRTRTDFRNRERTLIWKEKGQGEHWPSMEYNVNAEDYTWLDGCYVGKESWMMESEERDLGCDDAEESRGGNGRLKEAEVDDDDVASYREVSNGKPIAQAMRRSEMTVKGVADSL